MAILTFEDFLNEAKKSTSEKVVVGSVPLRKDIYQKNKEYVDSLITKNNGKRIAASQGQRHES